ncbi:bifunctional hydroxymethylpyrimidine kinase/phosphomethylpyrimidine kinase [Bhargavaea ginsengi]|uniref:bifunctional hydroxymethylpyrimidine kinase/phosphomethylpyrimidine kinase n=1 Tax=Bhargavaea ginsengi TaxID=426757 RepID=UPI00203FB362|nr:bifunctional hydroxymethylpyrimidine kinase/phosphomethylpyrimidine kinase [Bhargavaea ginsengi]MCM3086961.1 bifunctional hydroxymethylpyrimidine kinase/phosphomethylpyrimidine kinase [Bhargavaea ginsengi]
MTSVALTIAGSDSGGGAGIQADLKTFQELGVFGTSALTAVTAQNTLGVHGVWPLGPESVRAQMEVVFADFEVSAVKTGMLFSGEIIGEVAAGLAGAGHPMLVVDPVMIAKGGAHLLREEAVEAMREKVLPMSTVITPNIPEAEVLAGMNILNPEDMEEAGRRLIEMGTRSVVIKGGHLEKEERACDLFMDGRGERIWLSAERIQTKDTHGTGCTFSAALTAFLAAGEPLEKAVVGAKRFIHAAISDGLGLGAGHGPTNHWAYHRAGSALKGEVLIDS